MAVIGLDLGGTKLSGAIFQNNGDMSGYTSVPLGKRTGNDVGILIRDMTVQLLNQAASEKINIEAIGCCVPGIVYHATGNVWAPNIPGWEKYPLKKSLQETEELNKIPVFLDNDRACSIMGEVWQGAAQGCKDAVFLAVGTGIGAGILSDGHIIRGKSDIAGAIGWMALNQPFLDKYIPVGCFEYHASGDGLVRVAKEYLSDHREIKSTLAKTKELTARQIFSAWEEGDPLASRVLEQAVIFWGMAAANLVSLFNPEIIIFGGGVFGPAAKIMDRIWNEARKWAQPISINQVKFTASMLGSNAGIFGSARIAMTGLLI